MIGWVDRALDILSRGQTCALITLCALEGSVPASLGAKLLVWEDGQCGTIGGGNLEWTAIGQARKLLGQRETGYLLQDYPLGALLRQCCGGYVRLFIERLDAASRPWIADLAQALEAGCPVELQTEWRGPAVKKSIANAPPNDDTGPSLVLCSAEGPLENGVRVSRASCQGMIERIVPPAVPVFVFGAGHVGQAMIPVLQTLPASITWIDSRPRLLPAEPRPGVRTLLSAHPEKEVGSAPDGTIFLVFTHSHDIDFDVTAAILTENRFRYCGLIGSRTKRTRFVRRFRDQGIADSTIARLTCPIGLPALKSKSPAIIAIGVAADIARFFDPASSHKGACETRSISHDH